MGKGARLRREHRYSRITRQLWQGQYRQDEAAAWRAVRQLRALAKDLPAGHPDQQWVLASLGVGLCMVGEHDDQLLAESLVVLEQAAALGGPGRVMPLLNLHAALIDRYLTVPEPGVLHRVIEIARELAGEPLNGEVAARVAARIAELSVAVWDAADHGRHTDRVPAAIEVAELAVALTPPSDPGLPERRYNLALALFLAGRATGAAHMLKAALAQARQAAAAGGHDAGHVERLSLFGNILQEHGRSRSDRAAVDEAVAVMSAVIAATPPDDPRYGGRLNTLGNALRGVYECGGGVDALRRAVDAYRAGVEATLPGDDDYPGRVANYGTVLCYLYDQTGETAALDAGVAAVREALAAVPDTHPERPAFLQELGYVLRTLGSRRDSLAVLREAAGVQREALRALGPGSPLRPAVQNSLGAALWAVCDRCDLPERDRPGVFAEALEVLSEVVRTVPVDHPLHRAASVNLAQVHLARAEHTGDGDDQERGMALLALLVDEAPAGTADRASVLAAYAQAAFGSGQVEVALDAARAAVRTQTAPVADRLGMARWWGATAAATGRWDSAREAYELGMALLPRLLAGQLPHDDQERQLSRLAGFGPAAAACALHYGDPAQALVFAEQGRGVLLSRTLGLRDDLARLRQDRPDLADRLVALREAADPPRPEDRPFQPDLPARWDELVAQIRAMPGYEGFQRAESIGDLGPAAADGPVVIVNLTQARSDALILTAGRADEADVTAVALPGLREDDAIERVIQLLEVADRPEDSTAQAGLTDLLGWLWDTACGPVLDALELTGPPPPGAPWPRVWWIPTGELAFLPLHAAGHHDTRGEPRPRTVLDRVLSSYTPTVRALLRARSQPMPPADRHVLAVAAGQAPGAAALPRAASEAAAVAHRLPGSVELSGPAATRPALLAALPDHPWLHLACHAHADLGHSTASHLLLHDGPLGVRDIARLSLDGQELAFLSACETGRGTAALADESLHLGGAFQLAGYRHVIATHWQVRDQLASRVADMIYDRLLPIPHGALAGRTVAASVHEITRLLRAADPAKPALWAPYLHLGP